jgi:hypothetical protein
MPDNLWRLSPPKIVTGQYLFVGFLKNPTNKYWLSALLRREGRRNTQETTSSAFAANA